MLSPDAVVPSTQTPRGRAGLVFVPGAALLLGFLFICASSDRPVQASSMQGREAGAVLFHEKGCEHCHGVDGVGTDRAPALTTVGKRRKKAQIEHQIEQGGNGMPAYSAVLQPDEIKWLVEFLHAKRKAPKQLKVTGVPVHGDVPAALPASDPGR
ncbi:MAG TPA: cytochrome c [Granulicella sp.]|jgi:mono/diheme cytochrome c family protein|nr:cytochrome c [Granulicella sp.]